MTRRAQQARRPAYCESAPRSFSLSASSRTPSQHSGEQSAKRAMCAITATLPRTHIASTSLFRAMLARRTGHFRVVRNSVVYAPHSSLDASTTYMMLRQAPTEQLLRGRAPALQAPRLHHKWPFPRLLHATIAIEQEARDAPDDLNHLAPRGAA